MTESALVFGESDNCQLRTESIEYHGVTDRNTVVTEGRADDDVRVGMQPPPVGGDGLEEGARFDAEEREIDRRATASFFALTIMLPKSSASWTSGCIRHACACSSVTTERENAESALVSGAKANA